MRILGLTGSIGMGKSTVARMARRLGVPMHDADATVHRLLGPGGRAVGAVEAAFPGVTVDGAVDRRALGRRVFADRLALARLEAILHPLVSQSERRFAAVQARRRRRAILLDVPLLFETGGQRRCDMTVAVIAPARVQAARVLGRGGMTPGRLAAIRARQTPDREKARLADAVLHTGLDRRNTLRSLHRALRRLHARPAERWGPGWPRRPRRQRQPRLRLHLR